MNFAVVTSKVFSICENKLKAKKDPNGPKSSVKTAWWRPLASLLSYLFDFSNRGVLIPLHYMQVGRLDVHS